MFGLGNTAVATEGLNSINAELVSNLSIRYQGKGPETRYSKEGWLMKTVSKIWPF